MKIRVFSFTLVFGFLALLVAPVSAHALLVRSVPEANAALARSPVQVEIYFSEALEPAFSSIQVLNASGSPVDNGDSRVDLADPTHLTVSIRSLADGVYTVSWKVVSTVDGHRTTGAYPFAVGNVDAAALAAAEATGKQVKLSLGEVLVKWLLYLSVAALTGGTLFTLAVWQPAHAFLRSSSPFGVPAAGSFCLHPLWRPLACLGLIGLLIAQIFGLLIQAGQASGTEIAAPWSVSASTVLFSTRYGVLWLTRLGLGLVLAGLLPVARTQWQRGLAIGAALLLLVTISLNSHAATEAQPVVPVFADWLHLLAASVWVGGLLYFVASLVTVGRLEPEMRTRLVARLISRFSALGLASVSILVLTGLYAAILRVGSFEALTGTFYGRVLLLKLLVALPMVLIAALNLLATGPRMRRAQGGGNPALVRRFRGLVSGEAVLGGALLLSVGLLTSLPPAQVSTTTVDRTMRTQADDLSITLDISPGRVGLNTFTVQVSSDGQPVANAKEAALRFTPTSANVAASEAQLSAQGNGQYSTKGAYLSLPDTWQVQVVIRREGHYDSFANFDFDARAAATAQAQAWNRSAGMLLILVALAYAFALRAVAPGRWRFATLGLAPALALIFAGGVVFYRQPATDQTTVVNPVPPNQASISAGQALYQANCVPCHGPTGKGDGPVGLTLNPRPADLTLHTAPGVHPDGQLFTWISDGLPGSVMPAFKTSFSETDRWNLVNYIRTLATK